jgi:subtilisin-like proprotein convertase family protein
MSLIMVIRKCWRQGVLCALFLLLSVAVFPCLADDSDFKMTFPVRVELYNPKVDVKLLNEMKMDIDHVLDGWARVYVNERGVEKLRANGFHVTILPDRAKEMARELRENPPTPDDSAKVSTVYHTYSTLTSDLELIAAAYPNITRLTSLGQSVQGRELWMMKISANPDLEEDEAEAAFISSMHGDEVSGKEHCYNLIDYLTSNYGTDSRVTELIDNTVLWIMPSMNPDGTELGQRSNANGYDLNRHFPDPYTSPSNTIVGRQPEIAAVMLWRAANTITLAANFHEGTLVANYPYDNNPTGTGGIYTASPDDDILISISLTYASNNPPMYASSTFPNGITNGTDWYAIDGGMQDWDYVFHGGFHVTMEVNNTKWSPGSQLPGLWADNFESMFSYLERVHEGIRGIVTDAQTGLPVAATISVQGNDRPAYTDPEVGDYHRLLYGGTYTLEVSAVGYTTAIIPGVVVVNGSPATRTDVALNPLAEELHYASHRVVGGNGNLDPGETDVIAVTLENLGGTATGISGTLVPASWFVDVLQPAAVYPDLNPGESSESTSPHYEVSISPLVPDTYKVGFALVWNTTEKSGASEPFFMSVGTPTCTSENAADVPLAISDNQVTVSQVTISPGTEIAEIEIPVNISHTYRGDLTIDLQSPVGTTVRLHNRTGSSASNVIGTYGVDLTSAEPLSAFNGESSAGTWTLTVEDHANGDTGTINSWSVDVCGSSVETDTPELLLKAVTRDAGGTIVEWWPYPGLTAYRVYRSNDPSALSFFADVTSEDGNDADTTFLDTSSGSIIYYIVTGIGPLGEGPKGHFGE